MKISNILSAVVSCCALAVPALAFDNEIEGIWTQTKHQCICEAECFPNTEHCQPCLAKTQYGTTCNSAENAIVCMNLCEHRHPSKGFKAFDQCMQTEANCGMFGPAPDVYDDCIKSYENAIYADFSDAQTTAEHRDMAKWVCEFAFRFAA